VCLFVNFREKIEFLFCDRKRVKNIKFILLYVSIKYSVRTVQTSKGEIYNKIRKEVIYLALVKQGSLLKLPAIYVLKRYPQRVCKVFGQSEHMNIKPIDTRQSEEE
jgi:hypothetical protein